MSRWINTYELWNIDGEVCIFKNHTDDGCSFVEHDENDGSIKSIINSIAQDLMFDIYGFKYHDTTFDYYLKKEDITMYSRLIKEKYSLIKEIIDLVKSKILSAPLKRVEEDEPIIKIYVDVDEVEKILEEKFNTKFGGVEENGRME